MILYKHKGDEKMLMKFNSKTQTNQIHFSSYDDFLENSLFLVDMLTKKYKIELYIELKHFLDIAKVDNLKNLSDFCKSNKIRLVIEQGVRG